MAANKKLMNESLVYERVVTHLDSSITRLKEEWDESASGDPSYEITISILRAAMKACTKHSNEVWKAVEDGAEVPEVVIEELANAIVMRSVSDYEKLISGEKSETAECNMDEIKYFWNNDAYGLTSVDMKNVRSRIEAASKEVNRLVAEEGEDIVRETAEARKVNRKNVLNGKLTHTCPMCGAKLFSQKKKCSKAYLIKCSGCDLSAIWNGTQYQSA